MATQAISYLLLKKFRKKVHLNRLVSETRALICELRLERKRTGFTGNSVAVIKHAVGIERIGKIPRRVSSNVRNTISVDRFRTRNS